MNVIIQTPRIIIREFAADDEDIYVALYKNEEVTKYIAKRTEPETRQKFRGALAEYDNGFKLSRWGMFNPADDAFMGVCMLKVSDNDNSRVELGYIFDEPYWGRGLATDLANALVKYGFETLGLTEICACTDPGNEASQKVLLKAGFIREGTVFWHQQDLPFFKIVKEIKN